jgi:hypothetical protein
MRCAICNLPTTLEESVRRKDAREFPEVYYPAVRLDADGREGHAECFMSEGLVPIPEIHREAWEAWFRNDLPRGFDPGLVA